MKMVWGTMLGQGKIKALRNSSYTGGERALRTVRRKWGFWEGGAGIRFGTPCGEGGAGGGKNNSNDLK